MHLWTFNHCLLRKTLPLQIPSRWYLAFLVFKKTNDALTANKLTWSGPFTFGFQGSWGWTAKTKSGNLRTHLHTTPSQGTGKAKWSRWFRDAGVAGWLLQESTLISKGISLSRRGCGLCLWTVTSHRRLSSSVLYSSFAPTRTVLYIRRWQSRLLWLTQTTSPLTLPALVTGVTHLQASRPGLYELCSPNKTSENPPWRGNTSIRHSFWASVTWWFHFLTSSAIRMHRKSWLLEMKWFLDRRF